MFNFLRSRFHFVECNEHSTYTEKQYTYFFLVELKWDDGVARKLRGTGACVYWSPYIFHSKWNALRNTFGPHYFLSFCFCFVQLNYVAHTFNGVDSSSSFSSIFDKIFLFGITTYGKQLRNFNEYAIKYFYAYGSCFYLPIALYTQNGNQCSESKQIIIWIFHLCFSEYFFSPRVVTLAATHLTNSLIPRFSTMSFVFIFHSFFFFACPHSLNGIWMRLSRALKSFAAI